MTSEAQLLPGILFILGNLTFFSFSSTCGFLSPLLAEIGIDRFLVDGRGLC
jgi:hypothetical protein